MPKKDKEVKLTNFIQEEKAVVETTAIPVCSGKLKTIRNAPTPTTAITRTIISGFISKMLYHWHKPLSRMVHHCLNR